VVGVAGTRAEGGLVLAQTAPNPARERTLVRFTLPAPRVVTLGVFDLQGRRVASLLRREPRGAGAHEVTLRTAGWPPGLYLCRLEAGTEIATRKLLVVR
jgi:hypothetical protein